MGNSVTDWVSPVEMVGDPYFAAGYHDFVRGVWFEHYDVLPARKQWLYELGRLHAASGNRMYNVDDFFRSITDGSIPLNVKKE